MTMQERQARRIWVIRTGEIESVRPDYHARAQSVRSAQAHAWGPLLSAAILATVLLLTTIRVAWPF